MLRSWLSSIAIPTRGIRADRPGLDVSRLSVPKDRNAIHVECSLATIGQNRPTVAHDRQPQIRHQRRRQYEIAVEAGIDTRRRLPTSVPLGLAREASQLLRVGHSRFLQSFCSPQRTASKMIQRLMPNPHQPDLGVRALVPQGLRGDNRILAERIASVVDIDSDNLPLVICLNKVADVPLVNRPPKAGRFLPRSADGPRRLPTIGRRCGFRIPHTSPPRGVSSTGYRLPLYYQPTPHPPNNNTHANPHQNPPPPPHPPPPNPPRRRLPIRPHARSYPLRHTHTAPHQHPRRAP